MKTNKPFLLVFWVLFFLLTWSTLCSAGRWEKRLETKLEYLKDIPEVAWVRVEKNQVFIGWKGLPRDFNLINRTAAVKANRAVGDDVLIWSVRHIHKNLGLARRSPLCTTRAKNGRVYDSTCRF